MSDKVAIFGDKYPYRNIKKPFKIKGLCEGIRPFKIPRKGGDEYGICSFDSHISISNDADHN
ncbi:MAG: hypothetical protein G01um101418_5 [Parcubacteria group bacterium Gr01-1014_18]|nr:MAG: hypothetical protein Greene041636_5 [Parcubacteria group bacterium Greene0416_36]TSC81511.1 MAG: hypothetical protein G01um101418_5 [Parcubacteria group bacterium Gr01-1014_18]TSC99678.1 MAG: hypothetical protein Greene101420_82 [Parcubacteria group bacterium Greene1014_20]TSD07129.1 MAG: hypothetical protein Greene07142_441 [Parcubacteria group bacterium Greene0714_2]